MNIPLSRAALPCSPYPSLCSGRGARSISLLLFTRPYAQPSLFSYPSQLNYHRRVPLLLLLFLLPAQRNKTFGGTRFSSPSRSYTTRDCYSLSGCAVRLRTRLFLRLGFVSWTRGLLVAETKLWNAFNSLILFLILFLILYQIEQKIWLTEFYDLKVWIIYGMFFEILEQWCFEVSDRFTWKFLCLFEVRICGKFL